MPAIPDKSLATNTRHASRIRHLPTKEKVSNLGGARGWIGLFGAAPTFTKYVSLVALPHILPGSKTDTIAGGSKRFSNLQLYHTGGHCTPDVSHFQFYLDPYQKPDALAGNKYPNSNRNNNSYCCRQILILHERTRRLTLDPCSKLTLSSSAACGRRATKE